MNTHLDTVLKYAKVPMLANDSMALTIFTENHQTASLRPLIVGIFKELNLTMWAVDIR